MAQVRKTIKLDSTRTLDNLEGSEGRNLHQLAARCGITLHVKGTKLMLDCPDRESWGKFMTGLNQLRQLGQRGSADPERVKEIVQGRNNRVQTKVASSMVVQPKSEGQRQYWNTLQKYEVVFGVGAPGTGKTLLAVAAAVKAFAAGDVKKIIITRPVVDAGESLGFLPGGLEDKIDPYLRPIFDSLELLLGIDGAQRLRKDGAIEIAPIAYLRGRTFSKAFVLLDEAQNCTPMQIKMFLTRLGEGSRMVVTGDRRQSDIRGINGLVYALEALRDVEAVGIVELSGKDIVRHELVGKMVDAFESLEQRG